MWGEDGFITRNRRDPPCWGGRTKGEQFFRRAEKGDRCDENWYWNNPRTLTHFQDGRPAPALLGFDEDIDFYCGHATNRHRQAIPPDQRAQWCTEANVNVLMPQYDLERFSMCRQYRWTMCAARGLLPGQNGSNAIRFATVPKRTQVSDPAPHPIGSCRSFAPVPGCTRGRSYASSDIFYASVCMLSAVCKNFFRLYMLNQGEDFHCELIDPGAAERFDEVRNMILDTLPEAVDENDRFNDDREDD